MSMSYIVAAIESGGSNLDSKASIDATALSRASLKDNQETSRCQKVRNIAKTIKSENENFSY